NGLIFAAAWDYDEDYNPVPVLITEMPSQANGGISEDGTTFTFKLKEGVTGDAMMITILSALGNFCRCALHKAHPQSLVMITQCA
ncbi:MAG TPA: hypothetical protein VHO69_00225, partial [Phototrophicaceae bacterium]|nr:hypothetical protein [Phototrophicaceae bacterium]